ncbi:MAG: ribosome silencing factor [Candidatus Omnitrophica bacterium]|nr:ribosome silencing factor [Candidatus Omnitrophota bacterium]MDD5429542.1 ribosome silencing factor [Candidatus Omnitrophota bacterium]
MPKKNTVKTRKSTAKKSSTSRARALKIARIVAAKQAEDVLILDVSKISSLCDYFVICSGTSARQVRAIYEEALRECKKDEVGVGHREADDDSHWALVDFFDVILHVFDSEARSFYNLEYLWKEAKKVPFKITSGKPREQNLR